MGIAMFSAPLPHYDNSEWAGARDIDAEVEAMLPKDIVKHAKKLSPEEAEAEVKRIVSAKPKQLVPDSLQQWTRWGQNSQLGPAPTPGQILPPGQFPPSFPNELN